MHPARPAGRRAPCATGSRTSATRVFAETLAVTTASRATMAAIGMRHVRTFHLAWKEPLPGSELGEVEYEVTRSQWLAGRSEAAS